MGAETVRNVVAIPSKRMYTPGNTTVPNSVKSILYTVNTRNY